MRSTSRALRHHAVTGPSSIELAAFYAYFGFTEIVAEETPDAAYIAALSGGAWTAAFIVKARNADGDVLEIIQPVLADGADRAAATRSWSHLAFTVGDCDKAAAELVERSGFVVGGPTTNPEAPFRVAYVRDPAGNLVEIVQPLTGPART